MKKVMMYSAGHPWLVLSVLGLVTLAALPYVDNLKVNISAESMVI